MKCFALIVIFFVAGPYCAYGVGDIEQCKKGLVENTKTLVDMCNAKSLPPGPEPFSDEDLKPFFEEAGLKIAKECRDAEKGTDCNKYTKISKCLSEKDLCSHSLKFPINV
uniref:LolSALOd n=1 Tax=Bichromomyia olmeca TaxID=715919 RepID=A0A1B1V3E4_9DIPT|nr:LolSALOd [Bichromomyia olmeca]